MSITTYTELKAAILDHSHRSDLTADDFIDLCESDLQVRAKLIEFEATGTITITAGSGTLPTGLVRTRSVYWDGNNNTPLKYLAPDRFDAVPEGGNGSFYTITGSTIKTAPNGSGTLGITYSAKFTPLSDSAPTNAILESFPDAYLYGSLFHLYGYTQDDDQQTKYNGLFERAIAKLIRQNNERKYGPSLRVVPA